MPASSRQHTALLVIGFVLLWNSGFIGAEFGLDYTGVFTLLSWRYGLLALILLVYLALRRQLYWPGARAAGLTAVVGLFAHGVWLSCVMLSLQLGIPAGIVALVVALQPMTVGALSGRVTGEPTSAGSWVGLVVGFAGVLIAVLGRAGLDDGPSLPAYLVPFGAVVAFTAASLLQRRIEVHSPADHVPVALALFYQSVATALVAAIPAIALEGLATRWTPEFVAILGWLIIAVSLAAYDLMWRLIERMDATRVASLFYFGPPVTMLMAWIAFGDTLRTGDLLGLAVIAVGVLLVYRTGRDRRS
ncbi:DMT family transporter [Wenzhouxiangella sp. XN24]|uniref:DMT family transporter n=1 Tax=Wenzhouxiangella sp. XN24 TaxID=2713569 RepID=UPI0013E9AEEC|nr:DMT family transporter [Wenzhouxiangella sp. XN24]NGX17590.1 DMT family transporter [Wenzhouxiangella sp. XN24]